MTLRTPPRLVLFASLALGACSPGEPPPATANRLLDSLRHLEIEPQPRQDAQAQWPPNASPTFLVRKRFRDRVARVLQETGPEVIDERVSLFGPSGTRYRFTVALPADAALRTGISWLAPKGSDSKTPPAFTIRLLSTEPAGSDQLLVSREFVPVPAAWSEIELDLSKWSGDEVTIELASGSASQQQLAWAAWSAPEVVSRPVETSREEGWDVLVVSLDTMRGDRVSATGYARLTTPFLDAYAQGGTRFDTALSSAPWTRPAHRSLFTGVYPLSNGGLKPRPVASALRRHGYRTEAWSGGGVMDPRLGLSRGFEVYRVGDWIRQLDQLETDLSRSRGRKRFLFLHTYEPHDPYIDTRFAEDLPAGRLDGYFDNRLWLEIRDSITDDEKRYVEALYDGDIAYTDAQLADLFERLEAAGSLDHTIVVITSDHGEQFWEHGSWRHGQGLHEEQIRIPLIVRLPDRLSRQLGVETGHVVSQQVRIIDLYPTLFDLLGIEMPGPVQGRSLVPLLQGQSLPEEPALAEYLNLVYRQSKALRQRNHKFIHTRWAPERNQPDSNELFDLRSDPTEQTDLSARRPELAQEFGQQLAAATEASWDKNAESLTQQEFDPGVEDRLRALGYLGGGG